MEEIDESTFFEAVDTLVNARQIYVFGAGSCKALTSFFTHYLKMLLGGRVQMLTASSQSEIFEEMLDISERDAVIGISFPRYSTRTLEAMNFARARGAQVIGLTDGPMSPIYATSTVCLTARTDMASFVDSMAAPLSVINALIVALGLRRKEELSEHFRLMEGIWDEYRVYVGKDRA
jgi:DNA-binding MurR/RpiR family transcriptional regulator